MPPREYYLPERNLVSQNEAAITERPDVPRSKFIGEKQRLMTIHAGYIYPFFIDEILPGDHMRYNITPLVRMATPLFPIFSKFRVDIHLFFTPARLVWTNWTKMHGEQDSPADSIAYTVPQLASPNGGWAINDIADHFGLPTVGQVAAGNSVSANALPFRMYNLIYNQWYRDQNLVNGLFVQLDNGPDNNANYSIRKRAKSHDYFTSALPWAQKFTAPTVPLLGTAPIKGIGFSAGAATVAGPVNFFETPGGAAVAYNNYYDFNIPGAGAYGLKADGANGNLQIFADLTAATGVNINQLRQAWLVQSLLEQDARGGTRYTEKLQAAFGVKNPDARLQRPEYIGGGTNDLNVTPIAQTVPVAGGTPLGSLGGAGTATGNNQASLAATEYGYVIGLISTRSELYYQQGLHKLWTRQTRYDFYTPILAGLGEQAVLRQEIYCTGVDADDTIVFGYMPRWDEYRQMYSDVTGLFKSTTAGNIDEWHSAQQFTAAPTLSPTFIEETPPMNRLLAAGSAADNMQFICDILIQREATRAMPTYGTPANLARL